MGWGFQLTVWSGSIKDLLLSQSLSGWGGVFNPSEEVADAISSYVAIPFRVGWGFQRGEAVTCYTGKITSQSLSGWGGVFNLAYLRREKFVELVVSQSLSGWGGVGFSTPGLPSERVAAVLVAIPFRVGWGFQQQKLYVVRSEVAGRNPFQGGVGFSTRFVQLVVPKGAYSRNPFQGGVGWGFQLAKGISFGGKVDTVAIPFRVGWGFQRPTKSTRLGKIHNVAIPFRVGWGQRQ